jgi:ubiquinol-cytochrome c reductase cytochrome c subunit
MSRVGSVNPAGLVPRSRLINSSTLGFVFVLVIAAVVVILGQPSAIRAAGAQSDSGPQLFAQYCASCHQATGLGIEGTFPPLAGNPSAADENYVESAILNGVSGPLEVLGVNYDTAMPAVVALTDPAEIQAVVQHVVGLASQSAADPGTGDSADPDAEEPTEPIVPDVDRGHDLFIGAARFDNGGAACASCHTAGSVGNLGGPGLGPDLTNVFGTLGGEAGLTGWLGNPPSATMRPIFGDHPLTEAEVAHLVAFLDDAVDQERPTSSVDRLTVAGIGGLIVLMAGMALLWRGMRQTYVERLRSRGRATPKTSRMRWRGRRAQTEATAGRRVADGSDPTGTGQALTGAGRKE